MGILGLPVLATGAVLEWDRNTEADLRDYVVYACFTPGCTVQRTAAMQQPGRIVQSPVGVKPTATIDLAGREGSVAVTANDTGGNESGLSVSVPFDQLAPAVPRNPVLK